MFSQDKGLGFKIANDLRLASDKLRRASFAPNQSPTGLDLEIQSVRDFLRAKPRQTLTEIEDWTGLSRQQIADALRVLAKEGCLGRIGNKFYLAEGS